MALKPGAVPGLVQSVVKKDDGAAPTRHVGVQGIDGGHQRGGAGFDGRPERVGQRRELD